MKKSVFIVLTIIFTYFFNVSIIQAIENYTIDTFIYSFDDYKILNQIVSFGSDSAYQEYESSPFTLYGVPCHAKVELWEGKVEAVNIVFDEIDQSIYDIIDRISILFGSYQNIDEEGDVFYWENNNVSITLGIHEPPAYIVLNRITFEDETDSYKEYYSSFGEVLQYHLDDRNLNCMQYEPYIGIQYCYCDITGDGIDELIVNRQIGKHGYTLYIYQDNGNDVEVLGSLEHDGGYIFAADNSLIVLYDDELSVLTWNGDKVTENILYINDEYNDLEELVAEELNLDDVYLIRDWINLINENEDNTEDYSDKVFIDSEKSNTLTVKTSEVSKDADKDERYNLNLYVYRMVTAPEGQSTLVFQKEPRGAFMNDYAFHSGDTIYVNDSWRNDGYAIAYQDGVYGYVDESYIDWSSDDTESTDNNPDIHESEQSDSSLMKKTKNDVEVKKDESNAEYMRWCFENNNGEPIDFSGIIGQNIYDYEDLFDEMRIKELEKTDEIIKRGNDGIAITCNGKGTIVRARIDGPDIDYRFGSFYIDVMPSNNIKDYIYELGLDSYDELMIDDWMIYTGKDKFFAFCKSEDGLYIKSMYYGLVGYCPFDLDKAVVTEGISKQKPDIIGKINYDTDLWNDLVDYNSDVEIYDKSIPAIIKVNEDDYNIFVHGSENDTELSVKRSGYVDLIKILFDDSAHVITATLIGEDITSDFTYGNINVIPDYFLLAEQPFEYLIENNDPVFLGSILGNMGVSSLDEVSVITNGDFTFLYNEGMLSNNHFYSEYVTLKGTTLIEIYAESGLDHNEPQVRQLSRYLKDSILYYDGDYSYEASKYSQTKKADTVYLNQYLGKRISDLPDMFNLSTKKKVDEYITYTTSDGIEFNVLSVTENKDSILYELIVGITMPKNVGEKYSIYGVNNSMTVSDFDEYCKNRHWIRAHGTYYCNDGNSIYKNSGDGLYYNLDPRSYKIYPAIVLDPDDLSRYMYYSVKDMERIFTDAKIIEEENVLSIITDDGVFTAIRINDNTDEAVVYKIGLGELSRNKNIYGIRKDMSQNEKDVLLENNGLYDNGYGCFDGIGDSFDSEKIVICDRLTDDSPFVKQINLLDRGKSFKELRESWQY